MNTKDFIHLLNKPYSLNERQTMELERILSEFPFLQSARAIHLKGLYNQDSFRYNIELKKTAAYTTDRSVLFDFITSEQFHSIQKEYFEEQEKAVQQISVEYNEVIKPAPDKLEDSILQSIKEAAPQPVEEEPVHEEPVKEAAEEKLEIGKPLEFNPDEKHSFSEWLQLSRLTPIKRDEEARQAAADEPISRKLEIIDRFIESNPKIVPAKATITPPANIERSTQDTSSLMTETLARVYLEQKKYTKAIQAYEILILKYPEKSAFFADRISEIKILQQNNN